MNAQRPTASADPSPRASSRAGTAPRPAGTAPRPAGRAPRPDGRLALGLAGSLLLLGLACRELLRFQPRTNLVVSLSGAVEEWFFEPSDSSPLVVMLLCAWLVWRRRARLAALWGQPGSPVVTLGLWGLASGIFVWALRFGAPDLQAVALVPVVLGAAHLLGGLAALRVTLLPAAVLLFAVPLPPPLMNQIVWKLQIWTADFTGLLLQGLGYSALVSGDHIVMSDGLFQIIETCSGLRSIETLALLSILMIDLFGRRGPHAVLLLLASPLVAFLINGLRCLGLIFNPHADIASIHNLQGIAMLLGGVLFLYFFDGLLERVLPEPARRSRSESRARRSGTRRRELGPRVALLAGFSALLLALSWLPRFEAPSARIQEPAEVLAHELGTWRSTDLKTDWLFLGKADFRRSLHRRYASGPDSVDVFLGQADPAERLRSYLSPKIAYPGGGWLQEQEESAQLAGREVTLRVLRKGARRLLVAHWFEESPGVAVESAHALLALGSSSARRASVPVAVRLSTALPSARASAAQRARRRIERFASALSPALHEMSQAEGSQAGASAGSVSRLPASSKGSPTPAPQTLRDGAAPDPLETPPPRG